MKILALLKVDDTLERDGLNFDEEMGWLNESGITMDDYISVPENYQLIESSILTKSLMENK